VPQVVTLPALTDELGDGWEMLDEGTFGEFYLRQYLSQQLDENSVEVAASGWGGDRYAVYRQESEQVIAMALRLAWDSAEDKAEFAAIYPQYPAYLFASNEELLTDDLACIAGPDDLICVAEVGADSLIIRAPDLDTAVLIFEQF
jgi:hypothetical protein